jgi:protein-histidine pros-kinase
MKLIVKFNLVLSLVFAIAFVVAGFFTHALLQRNAKAEIQENARIMIDSATAVRTYTSTQIKPLLKTQMTYTFMPQSVSAYSANEYFKLLRNKYPDYSYKEATLNPTNPSDRATDWEADIVRLFRQAPDKTEVVDERDTPAGRALYIAKPLKISDPACLDCHDTPDRAPRTVIEQYGSANGFGWKVGDIVAAQIITAPMTLPIQRANHAFTAFMLSLAAVFVVLIVAINASATSPFPTSRHPGRTKSALSPSRSGACGRAWWKPSRCWRTDFRAARANRASDGLDLLPSWEAFYAVSEEPRTFSFSFAGVLLDCSRKRQEKKGSAAGGRS